MLWQRYGATKSLCPLPQAPLPIAIVPLQQTACLAILCSRAWALIQGPAQRWGKGCSRLWGTSSAQSDTHFIIPHGGSPAWRNSPGKGKEARVNTGATQVPWSLCTRRLGSESRCHPLLLWNQKGLLQEPLFSQDTGRLRDKGPEAVVAPRPLPSPEVGRWLVLIMKTSALSFSKLPSDSWKAEMQDPQLFLPTCRRN